MKKTTNDSQQICSVRIGDSLYGLPIDNIVEIIGNARPQRVPLAPQFVGGIEHYRGDILTTVELRDLLGAKRSRENQDLLVVETSNGAFGALVDAVGEVLTVSSSEYEEHPPIPQGDRGSLFSGAYKLEDALLLMLNPERLEPMYLAEVRQD